MRTTLAMSLVVVLGWVVLCGCQSPDSSAPPDCPDCPSHVSYNLAAKDDLVPYCASASGTNTLALPYIPAPGVTNLLELVDNINAAGGFVKNVQRYVETGDDFKIYWAGGPDNFDLVPGEALIVHMDKGVDYRLINSHDGSWVLSLEGPSDPDSASGTNFIALPYASIASNAQELIDDINSGGTDVVEHVQRFNECTDEWDTYSPGSGQTPFRIFPGEGYLVKVTDTVQYLPTYY